MARWHGVSAVLALVDFVWIRMVRWANACNAKTALRYTTGNIWASWLFYRWCSIGFSSIWQRKRDGLSFLILLQFAQISNTFFFPVSLKESLFCMPAHCLRSWHPQWLHFCFTNHFGRWKFIRAKWQDWLIGTPFSTTQRPTMNPNCIARKKQCIRCKCENMCFPGWSSTAASIFLIFLQSNNGSRILLTVHHSDDARSPNSEC